jgi:hypothetical protein
MGGSWFIEQKFHLVFSHFNRRGQSSQSGKATRNEVAAFAWALSGLNHYTY